MAQYLYARVSTKKQLKDGNSLEDQAARLLKEYTEGKLFAEQYTGAKSDRPKFQEMLSLVKPGDTVVVTKIDRLSRKLEEGIKVIRELMEIGVKVHILNMGLVENTPIGKMMVTMMLAFSEFERDMIIERTQAGREYARENKEGYKEGRKTKITPQKEKLVLNLLEQGYSYRQIQEEYGINRGLIYKIVQVDKAKKITDAVEDLREAAQDAIRNAKDEYQVDYAIGLRRTADALDAENFDIDEDDIFVSEELEKENTSSDNDDNPFDDDDINPFDIFDNDIVDFG